MPTEASPDDSPRPTVGESEVRADRDAGESVAITAAGKSEDGAGTVSATKDTSAGHGSDQTPATEGEPGEGDAEAAPAPADVPRHVTVVRFVKTPYHIDLKRSRLKPGAFAPPPGSDEVSVVRQEHGGDDYCKQMALRNVRDTEYYGLAPGVVGAVLDAGAKAVLATPEVYDGHADIIAPYVKPLDEPLTPEQTHEMQEFLRSMVSHFDYYPDPDRGSSEWKGPSLARAS